MSVRVRLLARDAVGCQVEIPLSGAIVAQLAGARSEYDHVPRHKQAFRDRHGRILSLKIERDGCDYGRAV